MKYNLFPVVGVITLLVLFFTQGCSLKTEGNKSQQKREKYVAVEKKNEINIAKVKNGTITYSKLDTADSTMAGWWTGDGRLVLFNESERLLGGIITNRKWEEFAGISLYKAMEGKLTRVELPERVALVSPSPTKDKALVLRGLTKAKHGDTTGSLSVMDLQGKLKPVLKNGSQVTIQSSWAEVVTKWSSDGKYIIFNDSYSEIYLGEDQGEQIELKTLLQLDSNEKAFDAFWLPATGEVGFWHNKGEICSLMAVAPDGKSRELFRTVTTHSEIGHYYKPIENSEQIIVQEKGKNGIWVLNSKNGKRKHIDHDIRINDETGRYFLKAPFRKIDRQYHASNKEQIRITDAGDFESIATLPGWIEKAYLFPNGKDILLLEEKRVGLTSKPEILNDLYLYDTEKKHIHFIDSKVVRVVW